MQNNLGHASIGTTSGYLMTERDARLAAMKGFGQKATKRSEESFTGPTALSREHT